jgi:methylase of polypeptide subunit release factors
MICVANTPITGIKVYVNMQHKQKKGRRVMIKGREIFYLFVLILFIYFGLTTPIPPAESAMAGWIALAKVLSIITGVSLAVALTGYLVSLKYRKVYPLDIERFTDPEYTRRKYYIERDAKGAVLDLETGTGLSAIYAARKAEVTKVVAIDSSEEALETARENALSAKVSDKIEFRRGDLFQAVSRNESFDYIIINPPYVASHTREVVEQSLKDAKNYLNPGGTILAVIPQIDRSIVSKFGMDYEAEALEKEPMIVETLMHIYLRKKQLTYGEKAIPFEAKPVPPPAATTIVGSSETELLRHQVEREARGVVLSMGRDSGILAIVAAQKPEVTHVVAVDFNPKVLSEAQKNAASIGVSDKIEFRLGDLFQAVEERFDYIFFSPPAASLNLRSYYPGRFTELVGLMEPVDTNILRYQDEIIRRFLREAKTHLRPEGRILLQYSAFAGVTLDKGITPKEMAADYEVEVLEEDDLGFEKRLGLSLKPRTSTM